MHGDKTERVNSEKEKKEKMLATYMIFITPIYTCSLLLAEVLFNS